MLPKGVTVRPMGSEARKPWGGRLLEAAQCPDRARALGSLSEALMIPTDSPLAAIYLSDPVRWSKISPDSRLMEIAEWIKSECYEAMDLVSVPAISTLGD